jgi:hypothetical protein
MSACGFCGEDRQWTGGRDYHSPDCPWRMDHWTDTEWRRLIDTIDNGLGWAESESMEGPMSRAEVMGAVRRLVNQWRDFAEDDWP